jgi:hypothetical protein
LEQAIHYFTFCFISFHFWSRVSLCSPHWPPASASRLLELQSCTTTPGFLKNFFMGWWNGSSAKASARPWVQTPVLKINYFFHDKSYCVGQADLELLACSDPPC